MDVQMAQRLVERRKEMGLSQVELADRLGVSRQAVSKWERSESSPDTDNLIALAQLYGTTLDGLLYGEPETTAEPEPAAATDAEAAPDEKNGEADSDTDESAAAEAADASAHDGGEPADDADDAEPGAAPDNGTVHIGWNGIHVSDPAKGEEVHVGWNGVHVSNARKGEEVHVGPGGIHVDTPDDGGHSIHSNPDGTVTVDGTQYASMHEAHDALGADLGGKSDFERAWDRFPFPAVIILAYIATGLAIGSWTMPLMLAFLIPVYYMIGHAIDRRDPLGLLAGVYPLGATAWFLHQAFGLHEPHPAWVIFLTIPVVCGALGSLSKWWRKRRAA